MYLEMMTSSKCGYLGSRAGSGRNFLVKNVEDRNGKIVQFVFCSNLIVCGYRVSLLTPLQNFLVFILKKIPGEDFSIIVFLFANVIKYYVYCSFNWKC